MRATTAGVSGSSAAGRVIGSAPATSANATTSPGSTPGAEPAGQTTTTQLGQIELSVFINKTGLQAIGDNLFLETPASGAPQNGAAGSTGFGDLLQGNLEQANVEAVSEISDLIAAQRAYEMNAKVISATDQMLSSTANMFR